MSKILSVINVLTTATEIEWAYLLVRIRLLQGRDVDVALNAAELPGAAPGVATPEGAATPESAATPEGVAQALVEAVHPEDVTALAADM